MELHPKPKQPIQLNRPLIITVAGVVVTGLMLAIIGALTTSDKIKINKPTAEPKLATETTVIAPDLQKLPEDYRDVKAIKKYLTDQSGPQLEMLTQRFNDLLTEYAILKQELLSKKRTPDKLPDDPKAQSAKISPLTFGGVGSKMDNLLGPQDDRQRLPGAFGEGGMKSPLDTKDEMVATTQQEEYLRKKAYDDQRITLMKSGKDDADRVYNPHPVINPIPRPISKAGPITKHLVQAGTLIPATLITGIDSTLEGTLIAQVRADVFDTISGRYLLIPKGSKLLGEYRSMIRTGQRRVLMYYNRIIRPDGSSILIDRLLGADNAGKSGVEGSVDNHWGAILSSAAISTVLSVGTSIAGDRYNTGGNYPNARERLFSGASSGISQFGQTLVNRAMDMAPTINVPPGQQFDLLVNRDIALNRYSLRR